MNISLVAIKNLYGFLKPWGSFKRNEQEASETNHPPPGDLLLHMCLEIKVFNQKRTTLFKSIKQTNKQTPNTKSLAYLNKNCSNSVTSKTVCSFSKKPTGLMLGWKI